MNSLTAAGGVGGHALKAVAGGQLTLSVLGNARASESAEDDGVSDDGGDLVLGTE